MTNSTNDDVPDARVDLNDPLSVERWCRVLCVTEATLRGAVEEAGSSIAKVLQYLNTDPEQ